MRFSTKSTNPTGLSIRDASSSFRQTFSLTSNAATSPSSNWHTQRIDKRAGLCHRLSKSLAGQ